MTDLEPEQGWAYYRQRMKIDESYRDLKSLLGLERVMNKRQERMEQVLALVLLAYAVALLVGERLRDALFGEPEGPSQAPAATQRDPKAHPRGKQTQRGRRSKWKRYSGAFVLLKGYWPIPTAMRTAAVQQALATFAALVLPSVPTHV